MTLAASSLTGVSQKVSARHWQQTLLAFLLAAFTISCDEKHQSQNVESRPKRFQTATINNIEPRRDVAGKIIDAHGGCLQFFEGRYYLYGTAFGTNESSTALNCPFRVYSSPDLERWTYAGELLKDQPRGVYTRPCVVFNPHTHKYVLWYNWLPKLWNGQIAVATSDSPVGPFTIVNPNVRVFGSRPGDGSLFVDDDGTGYYIYTAIGEGYAVRVERLTPDYPRPALYYFAFNLTLTIQSKPVRDWIWAGWIPTGGGGVPARFRPRPWNRSRGCRRGAAAPPDRPVPAGCLAGCKAAARPR